MPTMEVVRIISSSLIKPENVNDDHHHHRIDLTPPDLSILMIPYIQAGLLFRKPTESQFKNPIDHLKNSLLRTLQFFPPLTGRLVSADHDDETTSFFIACNGAGAQFVHAVADGVSVADIVDSVYMPQFFHSLFQLNGVLNFEGISNPLLSVQVTELVDGIFIGCSINHSVLDGTSFWHFFNSWSDISRCDRISKPPILDRWFLDTADRPIRIPLFHHEQHQICKSTTQTETFPERIFHFSKENIKSLKSKANSEIGTDQIQISSLQAVLAHLWRYITKNRDLNSEDQTNYVMAAGTRSRLNPPLPEQYLGNAILYCFPTSTAKEIINSNAIGSIALTINKTIAKTTDVKIRNDLENWLKNPTLPDLSMLSSGKILVTSFCPRFNVYGNDFGWGRPVAMRGGNGGIFDGNLAIFSGKDEGSIDIAVSLLAQTFQCLENDHEFMGPITI